MSINSVVISGNLTRDAESRTTPSGTTVLNFGVAVNERHKNRTTGEWEDKANYVECTMFGTRAQAVAQYMTKGTKVCASGKLNYESWKAQDGSNRSRLSVTVDEIEFMSRRDAQEQKPSLASTYFDEDVPF